MLLTLTELSVAFSKVFLIAVSLIPVSLSKGLNTFKGEAPGRSPWIWDSQFRDVVSSFSTRFVFHISFYSFVTGWQAKAILP
jgi:hypothetical protein